MIGLHLLVLGAVVAAAAPRVLARAGWVYRSPRLGVAAWYAVLAAVLSAVTAAVVVLVAPWQRADAPVCVAWRWCVQAALGEFGAAGRAVAAAVLLVGLGLFTRLLMTAVRVVRSASARRSRHVQLLTLAGRPLAGLSATVIEHPRPAAFVVAGRSRRVVVTTGAVDVLTGDELAAVLAHERAHAGGRHDLLIDGVRLLQQAFPRMVLFSAARAQLCRLLELRADEVAATRHPPLSLARALVAMASAGTPTAPVPAIAAPVPAGALAATGGDAVERLHRLLSPPAPLTRGQRMALTVGIAVLAATPMALVVAARVFPVLGMCPTLPV